MNWHGYIAAALLLPQLLAPTGALAREVANYEKLSREANIASDVFGAALDRSLGANYRLRAVDATVLAQQGVLFELRLATPWINFDGESRSPAFKRVEFLSARREQTVISSESSIANRTVPAAPPTQTPD